MMAAILNTAILDSNTLLSSLRFTQKHSHSTLTLTQTNSIWLICWWQTSWILPSWIQLFWTLKTTSLIHFGSTWRWQPCWIVPSLIQPFWTKKILHSFLLMQLDDVQASWILPSWILSYWIQPFSTKKNFTHSFWLILMMAAILNSTFLESAILQKKLLSFILTQLDDGNHLGFCHLGFRHSHLGFRHLVIFSQIHSKTLSLHSDSDSN